MLTSGCASQVGNNTPTTVAVGTNHKACQEEDNEEDKKTKKKRGCEKRRATPSGVYVIQAGLDLDEMAHQLSWAGLGWAAVPHHQDLDHSLLLTLESANPWLDGFVPSLVLSLTVMVLRVLLTCGCASRAGLDLDVMARRPACGARQPGWAAVPDHQGSDHPC